MKESLKLLGVEASGLDFSGPNARLKLSDDEIFDIASKINNSSEKESYLRKCLESNPFGYVKSKRCLVEILKEKDFQYACDLILSVCKVEPVEPKNYFLFAEIAIKDNAWQVARSTLEVVKWLCSNEQKDILYEGEKLLKLVDEKILSKEIDNSKNTFWYTKTLDKYWILERLYYQSKINELIDYSFRLLDIFSSDPENYNVVYKALVRADHKEGFYKFIEYIKSLLSNDLNKQNLYLGMSYYSLSEFNTSASFLMEVLKKDPLNSKALFYLALGSLIDNKLKDFVIASQKILPTSEPMFIALYFIYSAVCNITLDKKEFPNQKNISHEISVIADKLINHNQIKLVKDIIIQFNKLEYFLILPHLPLYLSELFVSYKELEYAEKLLDGCNNVEIHRIKSWIYRCKGLDKLAEEELIKYRKNYTMQRDGGLDCKLIDLNLPSNVSNDVEQIFPFIKDAYEQTKKIIHDLDLEYGLNAMTCIETGCQDCCKKTFPYVSYIEYLYMKKWLDEQDSEFQNKIRQSSVEIVQRYRERYKKEPTFIVGKLTNQYKEYPLDFLFDCPYLGDNKCNIYEHRPFTCRAYGFGSQDGSRYKGCNYFFEQFKSATTLTKVRKVINIASFKNFAKLVDEKLIGKGIAAPIPVWFAQSHEETMEKIKKTILLHE